MARIYRDACGVPHVRGASVADVAHGQGLVTARDRAWQLERLRQRATGTTASTVGTTGEAWDRFAVSMRLVDTAQRAFARLGAETQAFLAAYVDGLNAALPTTADRATLVPELATTGVVAQEWPAWMPLATFHAQQVMFADIGPVLWQRRLEEVLGDDAHLLRHEGPLPAGSNAWAVGGARTASGAPMIGGDPHRTFESPGVYQQVRLACDDPDDERDRFDVVGFTFVGLPGVQHFAHAGDVAWAITNAMADYQDLDDVGPDHDGPTVMPGVGFRGPSTELADLGAEALLPLLRARTVDDVDAAFDAWVEPVNNLVMADVHGTVRYRWAGRVPVRDAGGAWTGWRDDPHRVDVGPDGRLVTANDRRGPESAELGAEFSPPHRRERIVALLADRTGLVADDFAAIHDDALLGGLDELRHLLPERLRDFDGVMRADSLAAGAFAAWRAAFVRRVAAHPAFDGLRAPAPDPVVAPWFDVAVAVGHALPALAAATTPLGIDLAVLARLADDDVADLEPAPWGDVHVFDPTHAFDGVAHLDAPTVPRTPVSGDQDCVRCTGGLPGVFEGAYRGSVARYVWDLADRTAGGWVVPMGASGLPGHEHHIDQLPLWAEARLAPIVTDWTELVEETS
ncbi:penicillin acylase family protein [Nocardioides sp. C4-1]|uniref:penicillin acylase family protein n=1 Tax=Nocardioides sp. C4-1 TaxID=3151851 RepID=UPI003263CA13